MNWFKNLFKKKAKKKDGPTPEQIEKVRENFLKEMERRRRKKRRRSKTGITKGAFGQCKRIPPGYTFTFPKVSEVRRLKREQEARERQEREVVANAN